MLYLYLFVFGLAAQAADVTIKVVDSLTGTPLERAKVLLTSENFGRFKKVTGITRSDGVATFLQVEPGLYSLECSSPDYVTVVGNSHQGPNIEVKGTDSIVQPLTIRLASGAVLSGRLLTSSGLPIKGANVKTLYGRELPATTDEMGAFELRGVDSCNSDCLLRFELDESRQRNLVVPNPDATKPPTGLPPRVDKTLGPWGTGQQIRNLEIRLDFEPLMTLSGKITNIAGESTISLSRTSLNAFDLPIKELTSSDGAFEFSLLPAGAYSLRVRSLSARSSNVIPIRIEQGVDLRNQSFAMPTPAPISGVVQLDGKPYFDPGLAIFFTSRQEGIYLSVPAIMNRDGSFSAALTPGEWSIGLTFQNLIAKKRNLSTQQNEMLKIVSGTNLPILVLLTETATIRGLVLDNNERASKGIAVFTAADQSISRVMGGDDDGKFAITVPIGAYRVSAWSSKPAGGYNNLPSCAHTQTLTITRDTSDLKLRLCP